MAAPLAQSIRGHGWLSVQIKGVRFPMCGPALLQRFYVIGRRESESAKCKYRGAYTHIRFHGRTDLATTWTFDDRTAYMPFGTNPMEHCIEIVT